MVQALILYVVGIGLVSYLFWNINTNDAANPTDVPFWRGVIKLKRALVLFSIFVPIDASLQGFMVMKTIYRGVVQKVKVLSIYHAPRGWYLGYPLCSGRDAYINHPLD